MTVTTKSEIISHKILNEVTGEIEPKDFQQVKESKQIRGGFNLMYHKSYEEITEQVIKSSTDVKLFNWVTNQFTYQRIETPITYSVCKVRVSQPQFSRMIKHLVELDYLLRVSRGIYRLNPFIYVPFKAGAEELQKEWNELKQKEI